MDFDMASFVLGVGVVLIIAWVGYWMQAVIEKRQQEEDEWDRLMRAQSESLKEHPIPDQAGNFSEKYWSNQANQSEG